MAMTKLLGSLSLDLDNTWSYLKIHGDNKGSSLESHFSIFIPRVLEILNQLGFKITVFVVGKDAAEPENHEWLKMIVRQGHEMGNHSFYHEPWMQDRDEQAVFQELSIAHDAIYDATGQYPVGFRGPGFCHSSATLNAIRRLNYQFDASLLPTVIGPLARLYYFSSVKGLSEKEKGERKTLFGGLSVAFMPNDPFYWKTRHGDLLEIPVTTMPFFRVPFHLSYLIWLLNFSEGIAWAYLKFSIRMCKIAGVAPSILLHPPDFLGPEDVPLLSFFPGMNMERDKKLNFVKKALHELAENFELVPMSQHARDAVARHLEVKNLEC